MNMSPRPKEAKTSFARRSARISGPRRSGGADHRPLRDALVPPRQPARQRYVGLGGEPVEITDNDVGPGAYNTKGSFARRKT